MDVSQVTNYKALLVTGLISLAVAVGGNLVVNWLTAEKMALGYDLSTSETFSSSNGNIKITTLKINNSGSKSIDEVVLSISMTTGSIQEFKVSGIPANLYSISSKPNQVVMQSKYLNAGESYTIQLLTQATDQVDFLPSIDLRGRGVIGKLVQKNDGSSLLDVVTTATAAITIFAAFFSFKIRSGNSLASDIIDGHSGEQRDVVAYVLGVNGLSDDANDVRMLSRKISYWSIADYLCEKWIQSNDPDLQNKGAMSLKDLISYGSISPDSITLIKTCIVRLNHASGSASDESLLLELQKSKSDVVKHRIEKAGVNKFT
ncbi:hypothetical protein LH716_004149 [Vibrio vulnificus]|nr:hypothetical protein [Vibrio vulnificus]